MKMSLRQSVSLLALIAVTFMGGWFAARSFYAGEQAMGSLIESVSAIGYLEKEDRVNALRLLLLSAEGNVVRVADYGTPILDWYDSEAKRKWFQRYQRIRSSHQPIDYPDGGAFKKKVDDSLARLNPVDVAASGKSGK